MLQNNEKTAEVLKAEKIVEQAKARLAEAKRKASQQKRKEENQHKYMMGGIVHKYFPECYQFDEQELNRIIASGMKSEQCQRLTYGQLLSILLNIFHNNLYFKLLWN